MQFSRSAGLPSFVRLAARIAISGLIVLDASGCRWRSPAQPSAAVLAALPHDLLEAMNQDRAKNSVGVLSGSAQLSELASAWAQHVANAGALSHQDPEEILRRPDYKQYFAFGENLLVGSAGLTAAQIESVWMNSLEHKTNILFSPFNVAGVGYVTSSDGRLWIVVDFGGI